MASAFVGRDKELRQLLDLLAKAQRRSPATVMIGGDAGVGKTRLLAEFTKKAAAAGAFVLAGGCVPLGGGGIPYGPLTDALRLLVRRHGLSPVRKLAGPAWAELGGLVADFTGGEPRGSMTGSQVRVFGAVSRLLDHIGESKPVVLVFEDVHWADLSTVDLMAYLTRTKSDERMMLVCSYRSGLPPGHGLRTLLAEPEFTNRADRIGLDPVNGNDLRRLVSSLSAGPVSPERMERYVELSEGNPYFVEQLVAADDPASPTVRVPKSLSEIMTTRLERLSEPATRVVHVAAVAGRRVSDRLLATVLGDGPSLDDALRECLERRVLLAEEEEYVFQHALLREAAYDMIASRRERRRLHAAVAEALRTLTPDIDENPRVLPELAHHWFAAERGQEALDAAVRAGALAVRIRAFREAESQYRHALELWSRTPEAEAVAGVTREHILRRAADTARWAGHVDTAVDWARKAIEETDAEPARVGELYERLGSYLWEAGRSVESVEAYRQAYRLLNGQPPSAFSARVQSALAMAAVRGGRHTEALGLAERAVEEARSVGARPAEGRALNCIGLALTMLGRPAEGEAALRESLRIASEVDNLEDLLRAYGNLGVCLEHAGDMHGAVDTMLEGLEKARGLGVPRTRTRRAGVLVNNAGVALFRLGRWDEAAELLDEVLLHRPSSETLYLRLTRAEIDVARGRFAAADQLLDSVRSQPNSDPRFIASLYSCLAELACWRGDPAAARDAAAHGFEAVARTEDTRALLQMCAIGLRVAATSAEKSDQAGELIAMARQAGEDDAEAAALVRLCAAEESRRVGADALASWRDVAGAWADLDRPYPRAYALMREAEEAARQGDRGAASSALNAANTIATKLGAEPLRGEINRVVKRHRLSLARERKPTTQPAGLTERELDVLRELVSGKSNDEIARSLYISTRTVSVHLVSSYRKLDVRSRTQAVAKVRELGLFQE